MFLPLAGLVTFLLSAPAAAPAQPSEPCQAPVLRAVASEDNLLAPEQEEELGRVVANLLRLAYRVVEDPSITDYLQKVGDRVAAAWPGHGSLALRDRDHSLCFEVLEATTGTTRARVVVETGSAPFLAGRFFAAGDRLFVADHRGRVLAYTLDGKLVGRVFGRDATASPDGRHLVAETGAGRISVLASATLAPLASLDFGAEVSAVLFPSGSRRMIVVTSEQAVYEFDAASRSTGAVGR